ncbi:iron-containing alcohol dehydrogenase [Commensalibacter nepenthis]|uniref:Iron-containing alcohol dehydrogenase n=1 Tax=Commensalibacter nepenthis TaxID=3043872 RepID=A0ABT6Q7M6_9PROT|nr:iron-containing alcohol dehydrogenase [Commensalibacter sp. TBRC 10068]MDI2112881.1 iron-containing alcohol dehydrogenase [Commensalibacter sp. TBRC 10068]
MNHSISLPRYVEYGKNAIQKLPELLKKIGISAPFIISDQVMLALGFVDQLSDVLQEQDFGIFTNTVPEPTAQSIVNGVVAFELGQYDGIVALGGGSVIDSAKAIAILGRFGGKIQNYKFPYRIDKPGLPIIAIPTTAGTGSECTAVTIITDEITQEKMLCMGDGLLPTATIIDYRFTVTVPKRITADTGIDALTHAIEAYVSKKANLFSDQQALSAMRLIGKNILTVYHDGKNETAREAMLLAAMLAGVAFSNSSVALVHGMSRPIGAFFHVPHGLSNAILLPLVTEYSIGAASERYAQCAKAIGMAEEKDDILVANQKLIKGLYQLNKELEVPKIRSLGIEYDKFNQVIHIMAEQSLNSGSPFNNPKVPSASEIIEIYQNLWV